MNSFMENIEGRRAFLPPIDEAKLKYFAVVTMLIDHITYAFLERAPGTDGRVLCFSIPNGLLMDNIGRAIGRQAFPIFCFFLVEGFLHTRSRIKYFVRLLIFALLSQFPFQKCLFPQSDELHANVICTLAIGLLAIWVIDEMWTLCIQGIGDSAGRSSSDGRIADTDSAAGNIDGDRAAGKIADADSAAGKIDGDSAAGSCADVDSAAGKIADTDSAAGKIDGDSAAGSCADVDSAAGNIDGEKGSDKGIAGEESSGEVRIGKKSTEEDSSGEKNPLPGNRWENAEPAENRLYSVPLLRMIIFLAAGFGATAGFCKLAEVLQSDYGMGGVILIVLMYCLRRYRILSLFVSWAWMSWYNSFEIYAVPAFLLLACYNGKRGRQYKYFFYFFYPVHLLLIWLVRRHFFGI